ncbi:MAG: MauE/DoxX family redox-associated membrane protein [Thermodesulfobacteriota bacterium]
MNNVNTMTAPNRIFPLFTILVRLVLGGIFLYAGVPKIFDPAGFAETISLYQILPAPWIHPVAIVLPWLETLLGACLIFGIWLPGAVVMVNLLLFAFTGALVFNYARGLNIDCGCFTGNSTDSITLLTLLRDLVFVCMSVFLFFAVRRLSSLKRP